ncbi:dipeptidase [Salarchaeum japonicum]|uniref:Dipeptidase n=1 Tax=Salarchaeum japonicum TaxID=555573 RepID=A0AAV3SZK3_9EURY|nr:membrane dipeptidase [Salarchaeum japonicum]
MTIDGHTDVLLQCVDADDPVAALRARESGHLDLERARHAGLDAAFFAAFPPSPEMPDPVVDDDSYRYPFAPTPDFETARDSVHRMLSLLHRAAHELDGLHLVTAPGDLDRNGLGAIPHLEGAEAVRPDRSNLDFLYAAGLRSLGPVWSRPNEFGHGVPFQYPSTTDTGDGLTDAGRRLVRACDDRGILVDGAHMNAATLADTLAELDAPMAVTHTAAHAVSPHSRNLTDDQLRAVADEGGVIGLTFGASSYADQPDPDAGASVHDIAAHAAHIADAVGVEHVALGSDFDGARLVDELDDVTDLPVLADALRDAGFSETDLEKILGGNWERLLRRVL